MELSKKLGLGTVQFGLPYGISNREGQTPPDEVSRILNVATGFGINVLDTAAAYGNAEEVLGKNNLSSFLIVSKFIGTADASSLEVQFQKTLSSLKVKTLYAYLAHRPLEITKNEWQWKALNEYVAKGLILKRGFSLNHPSELALLLDEGYMPDIIQVPYNYLDRRFEPLMRQLKTQGCEIHSRSVFLQGLFFRDPDTLPVFFNEVKPVLIKLREMKTSVPGALLKFVLDKDFIDKVIIGVVNEKQLRKNLADLDTADALPLIDEVVSDLILMPSNWPKND